MRPLPSKAICADSSMSGSVSTGSILKPGGSQNFFGLLLRRQHLDRRLGTVVGGRVGRIVLLRAAQPAAAAAAGGRLTGRLGALGRALGSGRGRGGLGRHGYGGDENRAGHDERRDRAPNEALLHRMTPLIKPSPDVAALPAPGSSGPRTTSETITAVRSVAFQPRVRKRSVSEPERCSVTQFTPVTSPGRRLRLPS